MADEYPLRLRDPVHGLLRFSELEERVINSQPLQRLRGIRQLAMAYLGYPGAVHTRFDHSIGTMQVAGRMVDALRPHLEEKGIARDVDFQTAKRHVRLAALLHDVGHGPFSHVSDAPLDVVSGAYAATCGLDRAKLHELVTVDIIRCSEAISSCTAAEDREAVCELLDPMQPGRSVLRDIVSGSLDADKLDYLLRDSYFAGVRYGTIDLDRILSCLDVFADPETGWTYLALDEEGVAPVEQLLLAKYHMTLQVYRHKVRRVTDALLRRCIVLACDPDAGIGRVRALYAYTPSGADLEESRRFVEQYLLFDDGSLLSAILGAHACERASKIAGALLSRDLPREVFHETFDDLGLGALLSSRLKSADGEAAIQLQGELASELGVDPDFVVVDVQDVAAASPNAAGRDIDIEELYVLKSGTEHKFDQRSKVFENKARARPESFLSVFVPLTGDRAQRRSQRDHAAGVVAEIIGAMKGRH